MLNLSIVQVLAILYQILSKKPDFFDEVGGCSLEAVVTKVEVGGLSRIDYYIEAGNCLVFDRVAGLSKRVGGERGIWSVIKGLLVVDMYAGLAGWYGYLAAIVASNLQCAFYYYLAVDREVAVDAHS